MLLKALVSDRLNALALDLQQDRNIMILHRQWQVKQIGGKEVQRREMAQRRRKERGGDSSASYLSDLGPPAKPLLLSIHLLNYDFTSGLVC